MTLRKILLGSLGFSALVACTPKTADAPVSAPVEAEAPSPEVTVSETVEAAAPPAIDAGNDLCKSADYQSLIGTNAAAVTLPADLVHRIFKEGDPVTADFNAARLNIVTDADGVIIEVKCG